MQYAADNVDHNVCTLDGQNTFHGICIIALLTPKMETTKQIKRATVTEQDILDIGRINIQRITKEKTEKKPIFYEHIICPVSMDIHAGIDHLWKASMLLKVTKPMCS